MTFSKHAYTCAWLHSTHISASALHTFLVLFCALYDSPLIYGTPKGWPRNTALHTILNMAKSTFDRHLDLAIKCGMITTVQFKGSGNRRALVARMPNQTRKQAVRSAIEHLNRLDGHKAIKQLLIDHLEHPRYSTKESALFGRVIWGVLRAPFGISGYPKWDSQSFIMGLRDTQNGTLHIEILKEI